MRDDLDLLRKDLDIDVAQLFDRVREQAGRDASPTVAIIDLGTVKGAQKGGLGSILRATTRARRSKVVSRHILVDTLGLLLNVVVHPADVQDRDGALLLLRRARRLFPLINRIFADGGYAWEKMALVVWRTGAWKLEIVKRSRRSWICPLAEKVDCRKDLRLDQLQSPANS